jgi:hypothetical protein|tara:strand:- start:244 stop:501 length:258 start_codon:yes stop_codon:yes gene_type:complete
MAKKKGFFKAIKQAVKKKTEVEKVVKKVKKSPIDSYFGKVEGTMYTPHGLVSEAGKEFPGQEKHFASAEAALEWAKKHKKGLVKK